MRTHHVEHFKVCPWSVALKDESTGKMLAAFGLVEKWGKWPPGRDDPRVLSAFTVIANEINRVL